MVLVPRDGVAWPTWKLPDTDRDLSFSAAFGDHSFSAVELSFSAGELLEVFYLGTEGSTKV